LQANPADLLPKLEDAKKEYASLMQQAVEIQRTQMVVYLYLIHLLTITYKSLNVRILIELSFED